MNGIQGKVWKMVKMLYEQVLFGHYELDIFSVNSGGKQGCLLSPCLLNLVMTDLEQMLKETGGINMSNFELLGLYYAYNIVLFATNDDKLMSVLPITDHFAK